MNHYKASYIFKTSKASLQIAAKMAGKLQSKGCETHLKFEPAYFDGMHRRVRNFKSLTLWAFHPGMRSMQCLAVMECPKENLYYVEKFFTIFRWFKFTLKPPYSIAHDKL